MDEFTSLSSTFAGYVGDLDAEPVLRAIEVVCSLISWTVLASADKAGDGDGGRYQYDHYTPLNFLLTAGVLHWGFALGIVVVKRLALLDVQTTAKAELYGTGCVLGFAYTAFVAGAASSTQNHDEFGGDDSSVCHPRGHGVSHQQKSHADYFCSRVGASVAFAFFASAAAAGSLALIVLKQRSDQDGRPTDAYNPIGPPPPEADDPHTKFPGAYHISSTPMEGVGSDSIPQTKEAPVDL